MKKFIMLFLMFSLAGFEANAKGKSEPEPSGGDAEMLQTECPKVHGEEPGNPDGSKLRKVICYIPVQVFPVHKINELRELAYKERAKKIKKLPEREKDLIIEYILNYLKDECPSWMTPSDHVYCGCYIEKLYEYVEGEQKRDLFLMDWVSGKDESWRKSKRFKTFNEDMKENAGYCYSLSKERKMQSEKD